MLTKIEQWSIITYQKAVSFASRHYQPIIVNTHTDDMTEFTHRVRDRERERSNSEINRLPMWM